MIAFLLKFILLIFVIIIITGVFAAFSLFRSFGNIMKMFRGNRHYTGGNNRAGGYYRHNEEKDTVTDRRNPLKTNKKIFSKDEGEYVDFEEEK